MSPHRCFTLTAATVLMLAVVAPVAAVQPEREEVLLPEGSVIPLPGVCPFDVEILVLTSGQTLTTFFIQGRDEIMQLTTGPLKVRVTNLDTGESLDLNIPGPGRALIDEDRGTFTQEGPWLTVVLPGAFPEDPDFAGLFLTKGPVVYEFDPNTGEFLGFISCKGKVEDLCEALASL